MRSMGGIIVIDAKEWNGCDDDDRSVMSTVRHNEPPSRRVSPIQTLPLSAKYHFDRLKFICALPGLCKRVMIYISPCSVMYGTPQPTDVQAQREIQYRIFYR